MKKKRLALSCSKITALLRGVTSKHDGDFYYLNFLHTFGIANKLNSMKKHVKGKIFGGIVIPLEKGNILEFNQYMKSDNMSYIIYADTKMLIKNIDGCSNNPENSSAKKIGEQISFVYPVLTILGFDNIGNKHTLYRGKNFKKKFCESLIEHTKNIIDFEKKKNVIFNKKRPKISSRCKSMLHLWKSNVRKAC